jgi:hypothetical protein
MDCRASAAVLDWRALQRRFVRLQMHDPGTEIVAEGLEAMLRSRRHVQHVAGRAGDPLAVAIEDGGAGKHEINLVLIMRRHLWAQPARNEQLDGDVAALE